MTERLTARTATGYDRGILLEMLKGYYRRTMELTGDAPISFQGGERSEYFLTNEQTYPRTLQSIEGRGGAYVGVGQLLPFVHAAWQRAVHVYVVDSDASVPLAFTPLLGAMLFVAPTRADFIALTTGRQLLRYDNGPALAAMSGQELLNFADTIPRDSQVMGRTRAALPQIVSHAAPYPQRYEIWKTALDILSRMRGGIPSQTLRVLALSDDEGRGGPLANEESYRRHRKFASLSRMSGMVSVLEEGTGAVESAMAMSGQALGAIYTSNVENWTLHRATEGADPARYTSFFSALQSLPGWESAILVHSLFVLRQAAEPLEEYIDRSIPRGLTPEEAGAIAMRFVALKYLSTVYRPDAVPSPGILGRLLSSWRMDEEDPISSAISDAAELLGESSLPEDVFHEQMIASSEAYAGFSGEEQRLFRNNLRHLGAIGMTSSFGGLMVVDEVEQDMGGPEDVAQTNDGSGLLPDGATTLAIGDNNSAPLYVPCIVPSVFPVQ